MIFHLSRCADRSYGCLPIWRKLHSIVLQICAPGTCWYAYMHQHEQTPICEFTLVQHAWGINVSPCFFSAPVIFGVDYSVLDIGNIPVDWNDDCRKVTAFLVQLFDAHNWSYRQPTLSVGTAVVQHYTGKHFTLGCRNDTWIYSCAEILSTRSCLGCLPFVNSRFDLRWSLPVWKFQSICIHAFRGFI